MLQNRFIILGAFILLLSAFDISAATYTVNKIADSNDGLCDADCSLREAVAAASSDGAGSVVDFSLALSGMTIMVTDGQIVVPANTNIIGYGAKYLTISGNDNSRVFYITGSSAKLAGVTITGGNGMGTTLPQDTADAGAGGGGIRAYGGLTLDGVYFHANATAGKGGAIYFAVGGNVIRNSTFYSNTAGDTDSMGVWFGQGSQSTIHNSTFSPGQNVTANRTTITVRNITAPVKFTLLGTNGSLIFGNSVIGRVNTAAFATLGQSVGNNIVLIGGQGGATPIGYQSSDLQNTDPLLNDIGDYGGNTPTMSPTPGSPAIDGGSNSLTATAGLLYDQVGNIRVADGNGDSNAVVDIGAVEYLSVPAPKTVVMGSVTAPGGVPVSGTLVITDSQGKTQSARSNSFGLFTFRDVAVGEVVVYFSGKRRSTPVIAQAPEGGTTLSLSVQ